MFALITPPSPKAQLNKQIYIYSATCSISLGFHHKRLIHNWVWRLTWVEVVLYCMDGAQNKRGYYVMIIIRTPLILKTELKTLQVLKFNYFQGV